MAQSVNKMISMKIIYSKNNLNIPLCTVSHMKSTESFEGFWMFKTSNNVIDELFGFSDSTEFSNIFGTVAHDTSRIVDMKRLSDDKILSVNVPLIMLVYKKGILSNFSVHSILADKKYHMSGDTDNPIYNGEALQRLASDSMNKTFLENIMIEDDAIIQRFIANGNINCPLDKLAENFHVYHFTLDIKSLLQVYSNVFGNINTADNIISLLRKLQASNKQDNYVIEVSTNDYVYKGGK